MAMEIYTITIIISLLIPKGIFVCLLVLSDGKRDEIEGIKWTFKRNKKGERSMATFASFV